MTYVCRRHILSYKIFFTRDNRSAVLVHERTTLDIDLFFFISWHPSVRMTDIKSGVRRPCSFSDGCVCIHRNRRAMWEILIQTSRGRRLTSPYLTRTWWRRWTRTCLMVSALRIWSWLEIDCSSPPRNSGGRYGSDFLLSRDDCTATAYLLDQTHVYMCSLLIYRLNSIWSLSQLYLPATHRYTRRNSVNYWMREIGSSVD